MGQPTSKTPPLCTIAVALKFFGQDLSNFLSWLPEACELGFEVIVVQDNYFSNSRELESKIVQSFNKWGVIHILGKFGNPGAARNVALQHATQDWIVFWDSDDVGYPSLLQTELRIANEDDSKIIICPFSSYSEVLECITDFYVLKARTDLSRELLLRPGIWRIVFKRELIGLNRFPKARMGEDQAFLASISIFESRIRVAENVIYCYFYGGPDHLVRDNSAISDMKLSITHIRKVIKNLRGASFDFSQSLIVKQFITCLKRGDMKLRTWAMKGYLSILVTNPLKTLKSTLVVLRG